MHGKKKKKIFLFTISFFAYKYSYHLSHSSVINLLILFGCNILYSRPSDAIMPQQIDTECQQKKKRKGTKKSKEKMLKKEFHLLKKSLKLFKSIYSKN